MARTVFGTAAPTLAGQCDTQQSASSYSAAGCCSLVNRHLTSAITVIVSYYRLSVVTIQQKLRKELSALHYLTKVKILYKDITLHKSTELYTKWVSVCPHHNLQISHHLDLILGWPYSFDLLCLLECSFYSHARLCTVLDAPCRPPYCRFPKKRVNIQTRRTQKGWFYLWNTAWMSVILDVGVLGCNTVWTCNIALMMEAVITSETSVYFETTRRAIPKDSSSCMPP
jgi:hypothetical protein